MIEKNKTISGADEKTPSKSEYFSWINNTNEGSTEQHTLINLDFFKYLYDTYGMKLDIYAWDAGNLDGAGGTYEFIDGEKLSKQYPAGYAPVVQKAKEMGTRMGVWGGADGYGETEQDIAKRRDMLVKLCKDYDWALFKFDTVCGNLRENMRKEFVKTMQECRKYSPDLILLNHRNDLGEAEVYATTFLWEGVETYTDVHVFNTTTAPHNRAYIFSRGRTPQNKRLTEDHGVCISSSIDFFEDDLVYQAFNRCLILAPEIYGNPWLMRDDELSKLAYIFNLHRKYRDILVEGFPLGAAYGENAFVRGDGKRRFLSTGNASWTESNVCVALNEEIGLQPCKQVHVCMHFPYEKYIGTFPYGSVAKVVLPPFRAVLVEVCDADVATPVLTNCTYNIVCEKDKKVVNILVANGNIQLLAGGKTEDVPQLSTVGNFDVSLANPVKLGSLHQVEVPQNAEQLYEFACFGADNDSLEYRSLLRSGKTTIPQVQRARDAFFRQESYRLRGLETSIPFDGNPHTVFDTKSRLFEIYHGKGYRCRGGCLRVDFGKTICADRLEIEFFDGLQNPPHVFAPQIVQDNAQVSCDLATWQRAPLVEVQNLGQYDLRYFDYYIDKPTVNSGLRKKAVFAISGETRYFRMPEQVDRIFSIKAFCGNKQIVCENPHLTNLFASYEKSQTHSVAQGSVVLPKLPLHPYVAVAVEGTTGNEGVTCVAEIDGQLVPFPNRAPAYPANVYECYVRPVDGYYTFYLPIKPEWQGKEMRITVSFVNDATPVDVYLCDANKLRNGVIAELDKL